MEEQATQLMLVVWVVVQLTWKRPMEEAAGPLQEFSRHSQPARGGIELIRESRQKSDEERSGLCLRSDRAQGEPGQGRWGPSCC